MAIASPDVRNCRAAFGGLAARPNSRFTGAMESAKNSPRTLLERARASVREIMLALVITACAAGFIVAALMPGSTEPKVLVPTPR
jgi:hypothetical protein